MPVSNLCIKFNIGPQPIEFKHLNATTKFLEPGIYPQEVCFTTERHNFVKERGEFDVKNLTNNYLAFPACITYDARRCALQQ